MDELEPTQSPQDLPEPNETSWPTFFSQLNPFGNKDNKSNAKGKGEGEDSSGSLPVIQVESEGITSPNAYLPVMPSLGRNHSFFQHAADTTVSGGQFNIIAGDQLIINVNYTGSAAVEQVSTVTSLPPESRPGNGQSLALPESTAGVSIFFQRNPESQAERGTLTLEEGGAIQHTALLRSGQLGVLTPTSRFSHPRIENDAHGSRGAIFTIPDVITYHPSNGINDLILKKPLDTAGMGAERLILSQHGTNDETECLSQTSPPIVEGPGGESQNFSQTMPNPSLTNINENLTRENSKSASSRSASSSWGSRINPFLNKNNKSKVKGEGKDPQELQSPMAYKTEPVKAGNINSDDIVIALMGPSGSGKSQIIDTVTGQKTRAGNSLKSVTDEVSAHRVLGHRTYGNKLILVDTPGFDDTNKSDKQILEMISQWMAKTYKRHVTLTEILFVHRITDVRMSGTPHRNLRMFGELCGDKSAKNVVLLTTMWDKARNLEEAKKREAGLRDRYWNVMIHHGATVGRFYKDDPKSSWTIVDKMIQGHKLGQALLLQEEMVDVGKRLNETNVGKALYRDLQGLLNKQNKTIKSLEEQLEGGGTDADVEVEMAALRVEIENILKEFESLKIPLGRKITLFLKGFTKKEQAAPMAVAH